MEKQQKINKIKNQFGTQLNGVTKQKFSQLLRLKYKEAYYAYQIHAQEMRLTCYNNNLKQAQKELQSDFSIFTDLTIKNLEQLYALLYNNVTITKE